MTKKLQLGLPYFGGKQNQAKFMQQLFPSSFTKYCEPFGGTMKNFLKSDIDCSDVVYNDINYYQANLMMAYKFPKKFLREFRKQLKPGGYLHHPGLADTARHKSVLKAHYHDLFHSFSDYFAFSKPNPVGELTHVSWVDAVMYAFCLSHSVLGVPLKSFNYAHMSSSKPKFMVVVNHLQEHIVQCKYRNVNYFTQDAMQLIREQDAEGSFFVVDPGYVGMEHYYSNRSRKGTRQKAGKKLVKSTANDKMHIKLSQTLKGLKGKFMLCYYYHPILEKLYPRDRFTWVLKGWRRPSANSSTSTEKREDKGVELLILNYGKELGQNQSYRQHLMDSAKVLIPDAVGRRHRASYSVEFKHKVILMLESGLFRKKEILEGLGIKSYNTLSKWLEDKHRIEATLVYMKEAKDYLMELKQPLTKTRKAGTATGNIPLPEKARKIVANLRHQSLVSNKALREMFGITSGCVEKCYKEWRDVREAIPLRIKLARFLVHDHKMAA